VSSCDDVDPSPDALAFSGGRSILCFTPTADHQGRVLGEQVVLFLLVVTLLMKKKKQGGTSPQCLSVVVMVLLASTIEYFNRKVRRGVTLHNTFKKQSYSGSFFFFHITKERITWNLFYSPIIPLQ